jgi:hypothetical protein
MTFSFQKFVGRIVSLRQQRRRLPRDFSGCPTTPKTKKADVAEHPKVFDHVGLLFNEPPGTAGLLFI